MDQEKVAENNRGKLLKNKMSRKIKISVKVLKNKVNKAFQNINRECWGK